jgi:8-oxo-(d)GTP phosphatase
VDTSRTVLAAGAVVWRRQGDDIELLAVHRPKYDDWTFPKGKADRGERLPVTAVREILEESSVPIRLGAPMTTVRYRLPKTGATKQVSYWIGRPLDDGRITLEPNHEIDEARWVRLDELPELLTYGYDRGLLAEFRRLSERSEHKTRTLVVLRHATARSRSRWTGNDQRRTLSASGLREAHRLVPLLGAYGVADVVSSDSTRCVQTVEPYAAHLDAGIVTEPDLSEEDATAKQVAKRLRDLLGAKHPAVICTHRPVLPMVFEALDLPPVPLEQAQLLVVHHRGRTVVATELHRA